MRARYVFEHIMIPYLLDKRGERLVSALIMGGGAAVFNLCRSAYENADEPFDGKADDFSSEACRLDEKTVAVTLKMPEPEENGDCAKIYILSDESPFKTSFFTVEKSGGEQLLCGQSGDTHFTFGRYEDEKKALSLMLGIHKDTNE
ncbi:MAG: hypothetical protein II135_07780 [Clostridia bacterium]|nr:hypothetical protein [Clostridia bacterium]MBQ3869734.1 hypothetical protein [Clostridia bacterium]